mgnify:CR=1 FL=1
MSNIHQSILEKLAALNIDIYHYEDIVRCYILAKLNISHSKCTDYTDGIHTAEFDAEVFEKEIDVNHFSYIDAVIDDQFKDFDYDIIDKNILIKNYLIHLQKRVKALKK